MKANAYPKFLRLRKKSEFNRIKSGAGKFVANTFIVCYKPNHLNNPRLGIIVTKRCSKKAVIRNFLKRNIRESFRLIATDLKPFDYVVIVRHNSPTLDYATLRTEIDKTWQQWKN